MSVLVLYICVDEYALKYASKLTNREKAREGDRECEGEGIKLQSSCFVGWIGEDLRWKGTGIQFG